MMRYVRDNPLRLWVKQQQPERFHVISGIEVDGHPVSVMGNLFLLDAPEFVFVQCSRRLTTDEIQRQCAQALCCGGRGAVLISACISPGEKFIMQAAFEMGYPVILLLENGFAPRQKPAGRQFQACAEGRLLLVAPWPHHNDRRPITRTQCLALNALAQAISQRKVKRP